MHGHYRPPWRRFGPGRGWGRRATMALETPPRFSRTAASDPRPAVPPRFAGDDAVPRGLAVASAVTLRLLIVFGGLMLLALAAQRMLLVVVPFIISMLLATL